MERRVVYTLLALQLPDFMGSRGKRSFSSLSSPVQVKRTV